MGFFGRKGLGSNSNGPGKKGGGLSWMQAIQEAKIKKSRMNDLKNIYQENQSEFVLNKRVLVMFNTF